MIETAERIEARKKYSILFRPNGPSNCVNCGKIGRVDVHRKIPGKYGGKYIESNIELLCRSCHKIADANMKIEKNWEIIKPTRNGEIMSFISVRVPESLHRKLREKASKSGMKIQAIAAQAISNELNAKYEGA